MANQRTYGLQAWVERLGEAEFPALAAVVSDLQNLADAADASVQELADVLLRDASLTAKVLRVAGSAYYNPAQEVIRTISRAIVLIGFDNVRLISLSVTLIDSLLENAPREQLRELLARSFHAAVQARNLAGYVLSGRKEEVFIAALLHHLGDLAFWSCAAEQADELAVQLSHPGCKPEEAAQQVLGTSFRQLTLGLVKAWNLGETIALAHSATSQMEPAVKAVHLGVAISEAALHGWDSSQMGELLSQVSVFTGLELPDALAQVLSSADEAVKVAVTFGAGNLAELIPNTDPDVIRLQQEQRKARLLQPNLQILQQCLQDLGHMVSARADVGMILDSALNGLHRGAGLERVMLAVLTDGQSRFRAKRVMGEGAEAWVDCFDLEVAKGREGHIFSYALRHREPIWMGVPATYGLADLGTSEVRRWIGKGMFFIAPVYSGQREIGVLYADCRDSGRALKHEQFVAFQRFSTLISRCFEALGKRG